MSEFRQSQLAQLQAAADGRDGVALADSAACCMLQHNPARASLKR
jgi:hypothetical protein